MFIFVWSSQRICSAEEFDGQRQCDLIQELAKRVRDAERLVPFVETRHDAGYLIAPLPRSI
jgi:hypothetical protein